MTRRGYPLGGAPGPVAVDSLVPLWADVRTLSAGGAAVVVFTSPPEDDRSVRQTNLLRLRSSAAPVSVVVAETSAKTSRSRTVVVGKGQSATLRVALHVTVTATPHASVATALSYEWLDDDGDSVRETAAKDVTVTGLVEGAANVAGDWQSIGEAPDGAERCTLLTNGTLDFRLVDVTGATQLAFWPLTGVMELRAAPSGLLQVRHPGGSSTTRTCHVVWDLP